MVTTLVGTEGSKGLLGGLSVYSVGGSTLGVQGLL